MSKDILRHTQFVHTLFPFSGVSAGDDDADALSEGDLREFRESPNY